MKSIDRRESLVGAGLIAGGAAAADAHTLLVAMGRNTALGGCASMASLVLPAGMTSNGLPIGLEFDALNGSDRALLALGLSLGKVLGPTQAPDLS